MLLLQSQSAYLNQYAVLTNNDDSDWVSFSADVSESKARLVASSSYDGITIRYNRTLI